MERLGKGLSALIGQEEKESLIEIEIEKISIGDCKIRRELLEDEELIASIREKGILQPIIVVPKGELYEVIAGQRRFLSAKKAGLVKIPAIIKDVEKAEQLEIALVENIQRKNLNAIEEAEAYKRLQDEFGLTQEEIAKKVGKNRTSVANLLRLLGLPQKIKERIIKGEITAGHARAILSIPLEKEREGLADEIIKKKLSVREAENVSRETLGKDHELSALEDKARKALGTQVKIKGSLEKGKIEIEYYSKELLSGILEKIGIV
ncbi:ParB/RepB/Spo0J family partition protein, partial [bacterium]|nr:ParB/RepB/Spo0J family partition protein [bacterium]